MFGVDKGRLAAPLLGLGDDVEGQGRLARGLGPVDLDDTPSREAPDAQAQVEGDGPGRDGVDRDGGALLAEPHHAALAELLLDLGQSGLDGLAFGRLFLGLFVFHGFLLACSFALFHGVFLHASKIVR